MHPDADLVHTKSKESHILWSIKRYARYNYILLLPIGKNGEALPDSAGGTGIRKKKQAKQDKGSGEKQKHRMQTPMAIYSDLMADAGRM